MYVPVENDDVQILCVRSNNLVRILRLGNRAHSSTAKCRGMKTNEDFFCAGSLGFIQPLLQLLHLCFVSGPRSMPSRRRTIVVFPGPQENEASAVVIELVDEPLVRNPEVFQIWKSAQKTFDI